MEQPSALGVLLMYSLAILFYLLRLSGQGIRAAWVWLIA